MHMCFFDHINSILLSSEDTILIYQFKDVSVLTLTLLEQIVDYCTLCKQLLKKKLFLMAGFKDLMSEDEFMEFKKMIEYNKIPLLMIERHTHKTFDDHDNMTIIDKDLCVL